MGKIYTLEINFDFEPYSGLENDDEKAFQKVWSL